MEADEPQVLPALPGGSHHYLQAASDCSEPLVINLSNGELDQT